MEDPRKMGFEEFECSGFLVVSGELHRGMVVRLKKVVSMKIQRVRRERNGGNKA